jgi:Kef-type K+ transport system membrane component KefB
MPLLAINQHLFSLPLKSPVVVFCLVLFIILLAPILLNRLKIPGIIGLILSGVAIGPHGLNLLERNAAIELFSTIGLLYIMFLAGLELDLNEFRKNRHKSFVFGFYTFAIPLAIGYPVCYYLLQYDWKASLLIASMFSTHTLVAYPIASRLGIIKAEPVAITVGGTIITDTAVLLLFAVIIGSSTGELDQHFWLQLLISVSIFSAIVFGLFPIIARWFFKNLEGEKTSHFIFVLAIVFLSAFIAELAGLEPIIGAFMAGLTLNRIIPHASPLMNRIEFVGNALFIPFFLIGVGMLVDLSVLFRGPQALIIAGTLTVVAISGKWLAAWFTQLTFKYTSTQRNLIFGLSNSHAAATLAIILVGYKVGILDENVLNGTIILILITCLVASFVTENAGKKIAVSEGQTQMQFHDGHEKIVVSISNPVSVERLVDFAVMIRDPRSANSITAVSIVQDDDEAQSKVIQHKKLLQMAVHHASATDTHLDSHTTIDLNTASGINRAMREQLANTLVMDYVKETDFLGKMLGSTMDNIIRSNYHSIFFCHLVRPLNVGKKMLLLLAPHAEKENDFGFLLSKITRLARLSGLTLTTVCTPETQQFIHGFLQSQRISLPCTFDTYTDTDTLADVLRTAPDDDLIVLVGARKGSVSHHGILDVLPVKLERDHAINNFIVVYPDAEEGAFIESMYAMQDLEHNAIQKGVETISKWRHDLGQMFRPGDKSTEE